MKNAKYNTLNNLENHVATGVAGTVPKYPKPTKLIIKIANAALNIHPL